LQRQADAKKRAELERQLKAQVETEAEKRAELERQLSAQAEIEAEKRAQLEQELVEQRQAEAAKRAELERQLAARKAEDQKRASAELAAAAVAAANARSKSGLGASVDAPTTIRKTRTVADSNRPTFDPSPEPEPQSAAMNQLPVERRSPPIERNFTPTPPPSSTQGLGTSVPPDIEIERSEPQPALVAITQLKRTNYVAPKYPRAAQRRNTSGWVDLGFTVARDGTVHSIEIIESAPVNVFDEAATKAVSQWRFDPVIENGRPVEKRAGVRMMFSLE
jgi:TonB family protein